MGVKDPDKKVTLWQDNWTRVLQCTPAISEDSGATPSSHVNTSCNTQVVYSTLQLHYCWGQSGQNVTPRDMRVDHQVQSLHYFNSYAAFDRVDSSGLPTETVTNSLDDIIAIPTSAILPTANDCAKLRSNYIVLVAHTIEARLLHFKCPTCRPNISHNHSHEMYKKSEMVHFLII